MTAAREQTVSMPAGAIVRVQEVRASITRACSRCGAGNPSGDSHPRAWACKQCGQLRPADETVGDAGLIWRRQFIMQKGNRLWHWLFIMQKGNRLWHWLSHLPFIR